MPTFIVIPVAVMGAFFLYAAFVDVDVWWEQRQQRRAAEREAAKHRHPSSGNVRILP